MIDVDERDVAGRAVGTCCHLVPIEAPACHRGPRPGNVGLPALAQFRWRLSPVWRQYAAVVEVNDGVGLLFSGLSPLMVEDVAVEGDRLVVRSRTASGPAVWHRVGQGSQLPSADLGRSAARRQAGARSGACPTACVLDTGVRQNIP